MSGVARQRVTFLCFAKEKSPKEKSPKERRPCCLRPFAALRATCGARSIRGHVQTRLRLKQARALIRLALRFSAHTEGAFAVGFGAELPRIRPRPRLRPHSQVARRAPDCGSPFFCLLFFGEAKKREALSGASRQSPQGKAGQPKAPSPAPRSHKYRYKFRSCYRI